MSIVSIRDLTPIERQTLGRNVAAALRGHRYRRQRRKRRLAAINRSIAHCGEAVSQLLKPAIVVLH